MAQVPASSRGGGLPLTGGTLTGPLTVATTTSDEAFQVSAADPAAVLLNVYNNAGAEATIGADGALQITGLSQRVLNLVDSLNGVLLAGSTYGLQIRGYTSVPVDGVLAAGSLALWFDQTNGASKLKLRAKQADGTAVAAGLDGRDLSTAPAVSSASTLALGAAYQNTLGYDVLLTVYLSVTVNTSGVLKLGVGPTNTPTQQTLVTGLTATGLWPVPIYLPASYYALLSVSGTITVAVDGQIAMPV